MCASGGDRRSFSSRDMACYDACSLITNRNSEIHRKAGGFVKEELRARRAADAGKQVFAGSGGNETSRLGGFGEVRRSLHSPVSVFHEADCGFRGLIIRLSACRFGDEAPEGMPGLALITATREVLLDQLALLRRRYAPNVVGPCLVAKVILRFDHCSSLVQSLFETPLFELFAEPTQASHSNETDGARCNAECFSDSFVWNSRLSKKQHLNQVFASA